MSSGETSLPVVAVTMGDPAGVGAEVAVKALARPEVRRACRAVVVGSAAAVAAAVAQVGLPLAVRPVSAHELAADPGDGIPVLDCGCPAPGAITYGQVRADYGAAAYRYIATAIDLAQQGKVAAVATGPIHKEALHAAGYHYPGHTEIFTHLTHAQRTCMMLVVGDMRVSHVTTHCALGDVPARITPARVADVIGLTGEALERLGIDSPRIAVAGLNPHAGEGGLFGSEEQHIRAGMDMAARPAWRLTGPLPADTVFVRARAGEFDAVVAMYHDQGHIPVKLLGFHVNPATGQWEATSGVNVTLGLSIVRTSVDHGVAFDIAGRGKAEPGSMVDAILLAAKLARRGAAASAGAGTPAQYDQRP